MYNVYDKLKDLAPRRTALQSPRSDLESAAQILIMGTHVKQTPARAVWFG